MTDLGQVGLGLVASLRLTEPWPMLEGYHCCVGGMLAGAAPDGEAPGSAAGSIAIVVVPPFGYLGI
jgi:hypothetical protein